MINSIFTRIWDTHREIPLARRYPRSLCAVHVAFLCCWCCSSSWCCFSSMLFMLARCFYAGVMLLLVKLAAFSVIKWSVASSLRLLLAVSASTVRLLRTDWQTTDRGCWRPTIHGIKSLIRSIDAFFHRTIIFSFQTLSVYRIHDKIFCTVACHSSCY